MVLHFWAKIYLGNKLNKNICNENHIFIKFTNVGSNKPLAMMYKMKYRVPIYISKVFVIDNRKTCKVISSFDCVIAKLQCCEA